MFSKRSLSALGSSERQLLKSQSLRSGQCARCFHASIRRGADESNSKGNDQGTPYNAPKKGETRQQRSARISNEVAMLQRGPPPTASSASTGGLKGPGSVTGTYHAPPEVPGASAGFLKTPNEMGGEGQRMGENLSPGREGPNMQGVGRPVRYEDRRSEGPVEEPAEGGASVTSATSGGEDVMGGIAANPGHHREWVSKTGRSEQSQAKNHAQPASKPILSPTPAEPQMAKQLLDDRKRDLLQDGFGVSTIAGNNFKAVIKDRLKSTAIPFKPDLTPHTKRFGNLPRKLRASVVNKLVAGQYSFRDNRGGQLSPVLNEVSKVVTLNGSYLPNDRKRIMAKVGSLLPVQPAKKPAAKKTGEVKTKESKPRAAAA